MRPVEAGIDSQEGKSVENLNKYELEKINSTLRDLRLTLEAGENYLAMIAYCNEHGIRIKDHFDLSHLRGPGGAAGPDNDIIGVQVLFQRAQSEVAKHITKQQGDEIWKGIQAAREK